jgi:hypothetical protein
MNKKLCLFNTHKSQIFTFQSAKYNAFNSELHGNYYLQIIALISVAVNLSTVHFEDGWGKIIIAE